jgi:hypothetical protein
MSGEQSMDAAGNGGEHAVIVHFDYGSTDLSNLFDLEDELIAAVEAAGVGECDGHEIAMDGSDGYYYLYGPDADALFAVIRPLLVSTARISNPEVTLRYGPVNDPAAREVVVDLGTRTGSRE